MQLTSDFSIAVILINYKSASNTRQCIESIHKMDFLNTIVLVDNTPNDPELSSFRDDFSKLHLIYAAENIGFGRGNNIGISWVIDNTNCSHFFILNNDTVVESNALLILAECLNANPDVGIVTPRIVFMDEPDLLWYGGGDVSWMRGSAVVPGYRGSSHSELALTRRDVTFASGCALMIKRDLVKQLKGFNELFFMYEEDVELCIRAINLGWKIRYEPSALLMHSVQASSRGGQGYVEMLSPQNDNLNFYLYHVIRNRLINMRIHAKGFRRLIFILGFTALMIKKLAIYSIHKRWDAIYIIAKSFRAYRKIVFEYR